ncbi:Uncharacterised protein [Mycobacteroides abscessus subsp. abscessus]|nr:Uncharacterised protein [Mycobacteroides abscessus subsp. abscessus]
MPVTSAPSSRQAGVDWPQVSRKEKSAAGRRSFSMRAKFVPPRPPTSATATPASRNQATVGRLSPNPTSLTITGTGTPAARCSMRRGQDRKDRSPSGITISCTALRWICRASAASRSTARRA